MDNLTPEDLQELGLSSALLKAKEVSSIGKEESFEPPIVIDNIKNQKDESSLVESNAGQSSIPKYGGDEQDTSGPLKDGNYQVLDFADSAEVAEIFDESINNSSVTLHPWQVETSEQLCSAKPTSQHPYKFVLCACNGSGKDAYVIAPFVIWFAITKKRSLTIITSSSGVQLTAQTENYIKRLAEKVNAYFGGQQIFKIRQRFIKCNLTGSEIRLFATDEAGKAEGYHPIEPNAEMCIIVNEAKSVSKEIFGALKRCTGFNYWLNISTPGEPHGDFYKAFTNWPFKRHVSTFDCPHLSASEREEERIELGEHSALYRSKHLALFTSLGGSVIISAELYDRLAANPCSRKFTDWPLRIGGDLAAGGDECVLTGIRGNAIEKRVAFREKDTMVSADVIEFHLTNTFKVKKEHEHLYFDDGGVGRGIIDNLRRRGWNIRRILNQSPAIRKQEFGNRGAESWFRAKRILEENLFIIDDDEKFKTQITNRYYKQQSTQGRITLESKKDAKAHGRPSPDRADSFLLALTGLTIDDFLVEEKSNTEDKEDLTPIQSSLANKKGTYLGNSRESVELAYKNMLSPSKMLAASMNKKKQGKLLHGSLTAHFEKAGFHNN